MIASDHAPLIDIVGTYNGSSYSRTGERGSPAAYTADLLTGLRSRNCNAHILACSEDTSGDDPFFVRRSWNLDKPLTIFISALKSKAALIHFQHEIFLYGSRASTAIAVPFLFAFLRLLNRCLVVTVHGVPDPGDINKDFAKRNGYGRMPLSIIKGAFAMIYRALGFGAHAIIVHDKEFRDRLVHGYKVRPEKITVIPHALPELPAKVPRTEAAAFFGLPEGKSIVLFFGYVASYKGLDHLLAAWEKVVMMSPHFHLVIAGGINSKRRDDSEYQREYSELQARARAIGSTTWLGFVEGDKIGHLFGCTNLLVLPYTDLLSVSGPFHFAARYCVPVLCSSILSPVIPDSVPTSSLDADSLAQSIISAAHERPPQIFEQWQMERSPNEIARRHCDLYCTLSEKR